jgi:hypothetical protein
MHLKLKHREEGCTTSLTGCVAVNLELRLQTVRSHAGMSGHVILGRGSMCMVSEIIASSATEIRNVKIFFATHPLQRSPLVKLHVITLPEFLTTKLEPTLSGSLCFLTDFLTAILPSLQPNYTRVIDFIFCVLTL